MATNTNHLVSQLPNPSSLAAAAAAAVFMILTWLSDRAFPRAGTERH